MFAPLDSPLHDQAHEPMAGSLTPGMGFPKSWLNLLHWKGNAFRASKEWHNQYWRQKASEINSADDAADWMIGLWIARTLRMGDAQKGMEAMELEDKAKVLLLDALRDPKTKDRALARWQAQVEAVKNDWLPPSNPWLRAWDGGFKNPSGALAADLMEEKIITQTRERWGRLESLCANAREKTAGGSWLQFTFSMIEEQKGHERQESAQELNAELRWALWVLKTLRPDLPEENDAGKKAWEGVAEKTCKCASLNSSKHLADLLEIILRSLPSAQEVMGRAAARALRSEKKEDGELRKGPSFHMSVNPMFEPSSEMDHEERIRLLRKHERSFESRKRILGLCAWWRSLGEGANVFWEGFEKETTGLEKKELFSFLLAERKSSSESFFKGAMAVCERAEKQVPGSAFEQFDETAWKAIWEASATHQPGRPERLWKIERWAMNHPSAPVCREEHFKRMGEKEKAGYEALVLGKALEENAPEEKRAKKPRL